MGPRPGGCTRSSLSPSLAQMSTARQELKLRNRTTKVSRRRAKAGGSRCWARQPACVQPRRSLRPSYSPSPEGRELRVVSRQPGWVQVTDPGSNQSGWIADTSLVALDRKTKEQQSAGASTQQDSSAASRRQKAASASPQRRQSNPPVQRRSRDAGPETYESTEGPPPRLRGRWMPWEAEMGAPREQFEDRPLVAPPRRLRLLRSGRRGGLDSLYFTQGAGFRRTSRRVRTRRYPSPGNN